MGIQGFSQPYSTLAIWSADVKHKPNDVRAFLSARGSWFIPCLGMYKGVTELSYLTAWSDFEEIAIELCAGQESVVRLGSMDSLSRRKATLVFRGGADDIDLGRMYSIPAADIHDHDAWTIPLQQPPGNLNAFVCGFPDKFGFMPT